MARVGETIDGKYEILREIGRGGMSVVYLAMDKRLNKQWAIKEYRKDSQFSKLAEESLLKEATLMKRLDHPRLPRIVDIIKSQNSIYVVMDYIEGEPLNKVLDAYGAQPQEAVVEWGLQLADVLDYLHTLTPPVIYRDMKPSNIMLKPDGTIRLFDFGIAKEIVDDELGGTTVGTRGYAAPEQFSQGMKVDARTDIYALGVTLYHLVTGKNPAEPPYELYPIRHWNPSLSSGLEWLIQKCTQLNPEDRYQSCAEVTYVLENLEKFETAYKSKQRMKFNFFLASVALTVVFAIVGTTGLFLKNKVETENYDNYMAMNTIAGYEQAIAYDEKKTVAYSRLVEVMRSQVKSILVVPPADGSLQSDQILTKDIDTYFSAARLNNLKTADLNAYIQVNYELGRLFWDYYQPADGQLASVMTASKPYFEAALLAAADSADKHGGLSDQQFNLAQSYYMISFFYGNKDDMHNGIEVKASDAAKSLGLPGINEKGYFENAFRSFWEVNINLLALIENEASIPTPIKLDTLSKLTYLLQDNYYDFKSQGEVTADEMKALYDSLNQAQAASGTGVSAGSDDEAALQQVKSSLTSAKRNIEGLYKIELEEVQ